MKNILYTFMFLSFAVANAHDENQPCYTISVECIIRILLLQNGKK
ncbi:MAG: hypothetical protein AB7R69_05570 [Candidatus Babeliales bacterium]